VRIRGNAPQVYEKYLTLARDAASAGDRIASESYFQFAEHYFRIMNDSTDPQRSGQPSRARPEQPRDVQERPTDDQGQLLVDQEQPHVEWPNDGSGTNGAAAETAPATEEPAPQEDAPQRQVSKTRQRPRRRPTNGSEEPAANADAKPEPVAEDAKVATKPETGDEDSTTPVE
jgi:cell division protein FtsN